MNKYERSWLIPQKFTSTYGITENGKTMIYFATWWQWRGWCLFYKAKKV